LNFYIECFTVIAGSNKNVGTLVILIAGSSTSIGGPDIIDIAGSINYAGFLVCWQYFSFIAGDCESLVKFGVLIPLKLYFIVSNYTDCF